jgi:4-nitrophenyl phosphatase
MNGMSDGNNTTVVTPQDIAALSAYIFDLDGVLWRGSEPIEGAVEAVQRLRGAGKRILYCTNNSSKTPREYAERLRGMGLELEDEDVLTSSWAAAVYLSAQFTGPYSVFVIGEEGLDSALQKGGARIVPEHDVDGDTRVDCVVVGIDRSFNYERLNLAQQLILRGAQFVATNRDATYPVENGVVPGSGAIVAAVEAASGTTPVVIGKPRPAMLQLALDRFNLKAETTAMVGDRLDTDIAAARNAGLLALFVATGVTTPDQARKAKGQQRPHALFPNLAALCQVALHDTNAAPVAEATPAPEAAAPEAAAPEAAAPESTPQPEAVVSAEPEEAQARAEAPAETAPNAAPQSTPGGSFSFADAAEPAGTDETPSTASAVEAGQVAQALADAPVVATPEAATPVAHTPEAAAPEAAAPEAAAPETTEAADKDASWDLSELEGIEWGDEAEAAAKPTDELAKKTDDTQSTAPATGAAEENPADPFASWFEGVDEKKS